MIVTAQHAYASSAESPSRTGCTRAHETVTMPDSMIGKREGGLWEEEPELP